MHVMPVKGFSHMNIIISRARVDGALRPPCYFSRPLAPLFWSPGVDSAPLLAARLKTHHNPTILTWKYKFSGERPVTLPRPQLQCLTPNPPRCLCPLDPLLLSDDLHPGYGINGMHSRLHISVVCEVTWFSVEILKSNQLCQIMLQKHRSAADTQTRVVITQSVNQSELFQVA